MPSTSTPAKASAKPRTIGVKQIAEHLDVEPRVCARSCAAPSERSAGAPATSEVPYGPRGEEGHRRVEGGAGEEGGVARRVVAAASHIGRAFASGLCAGLICVAAVGRRGYTRQRDFAPVLVPASGTRPFGGSAAFRKAAGSPCEGHREGRP